MASAGILPLYTRQSSFCLKRFPRSRTKLLSSLLCVVLFVLCVMLSVLYTDGNRFHFLHRRVAGEFTVKPSFKYTWNDSYNDSRVNHDSHHGQDKQNLMKKVMDDWSYNLKSWWHRGSNKRMVIQGGEDADPIARERRDKVKEMMLHAWKGYKRFAWGMNELRPIRKTGQTAGLFGRQDMGATIVDSLDTLFIMGLNEEFEEAKNWVKNKLQFSKLNSDVSVFEMNIRFVGGLLSAYALTGETVFKAKALYLAKRLLPAFRTNSGIPFGIVNTASGSSKNHRWASGGSSILSEVGTLHLEFSYLSDVTGDSIFREKVNKIRKVIQMNHRPGDLYPNYLNPWSGRGGEKHTSMGAFGDSFYEYLIKSYIQSNSMDTVAKEMYTDAIEAVTYYLVVKSSSGLTYLAESLNGHLVHKMEHLACFTGGMYALGATFIEDENSKQHKEIAEGLAETCHESYVRSATGIGPDSFRFDNVNEATTDKASEKHYSLRPEVVETWFYLWRLTKDKKYREWAWEAVMAMDKHCRVEHGFSGIRDVYNKNTQKDDVQQSFLLAETFKYLYLIFSDDSLISLDEWVFNTEAHPIPIQDKNTLYRKASQGA